MYIGPWQELELARLLARHRRSTVNTQLQSITRRRSEWDTDDNNNINIPTRIVLPHIPSQRKRVVVGQKGKIVERCCDDAALDRHSCEPITSSRLRYDRLLGVADNSKTVEGLSLPQLVPKARRYTMASKSRTTPRRSTTDKRRMHLEKVRRVYLQEYPSGEDTTESLPSSSQLITDNNELNDPLVAWSDGLDINKLLESPQLSMAPIG